MSTLLRILAGGLMAVALTSASCAPLAGRTAQVDPIRPVVLSLDYNAARDLAVLEICSLGGPPERNRPCYLAQVSLAGLQPEQTTVPEIVVGGVEYRYGSPALSPSGDALYAARRRGEDWASRGFRSAVEIVRIDLATRVITPIAGVQDGNFSVANVLEDANGDELLIIFDTLGLTPRGIPVASKIITMTVRNGMLVPESRRDFDDMGASGFELPMAGLGYVKVGVQRRGNTVVARGFWGITPEDIRSVQHQIYPTLEAAITHVAGCEADACTSSVALRAFYTASEMKRVPAFDSRQIKGIDSEPQHFIVSFKDRPAAFFRSDSPYPLARISYDLGSGAVVVPSSAIDQGSQIPLAYFEGDGLSFDDRSDYILNLASFN